MIRPYSQLFENQFSPHLEVMEFIFPEIKMKTESKNETIVKDNQQVIEDKQCEETSIVVIDDSSLKNITPKQFFRRK